MSKFIKLTVRATGLPLVLNADLIESMIPLDGYVSIRQSGMPFGEADHVLESLEQIEAQLLRDEFAMAALNATIIGLNSIVGNHEHHGWSDQELASESYRIADAMLKERVK